MKNKNTFRKSRKNLIVQYNLHRNISILLGITREETVSKLKIELQPNTVSSDSTNFHIQTVKRHKNLSKIKHIGVHHHIRTSE